MWKCHIIVLIGIFSTAMSKREIKRGHLVNNKQEDLDSKKIIPTTTSRSNKGDAVVEKFVETLMSSERYLKMVETVERKLTHLDATFHEKTNSILKHLIEMLRLVKSPPTVELENALYSVKSDLDKLKHYLAERLHKPHVRVNRDRKGRKKNEYQDQSLWKKEYEDELTDAMLSTRRRENVTRVAQSTGAMDNEMVLEKLMETLTSSERYLKKVDSVDFRLNRLDIEIHQKTDNILKQLMEIMKSVRGQDYADKLETVLESLKTDVNQIKLMIDKLHKFDNAVDGPDFHSESVLDSRLSNLENNIQNIVTGVESIVTTISDVKNRQYSKPFSRTEASGSIDTFSLINEFRRTLHEQKTKKCECKNGRVDRSERYPTDCHEIQMQGFNVSGIYKIKPEDMEPFYVLCDLITAGGGWTVFQNRFDGSQDFYKGWSDYKHGFGNLAGEFWLGLEKLSYLTNQKLYELRVEMETEHGQEAYAGYSVFTVGPEYESYRISTLGSFYGTAGDSLSYHAGQKFSTLDADNDEWKDGACALEHGGAWWYKECDKSNLNGKYSMSADEHRGQSIYWISFKGPSSPCTKSKMMIRPLPASKPIDFHENNRKILERSKLRPVPEKIKGVHTKDFKATYDLNHRSPYRYDEPPRVDALFHHYV
ncbi:fibroleukin-like [Achroia grisella]|uniref:fibroleukin-like n=1 Tax=Achroia grisella TaxID=688607 RepID=UPI0027D28557|nr:fibroleukin-like [Achroia grisella]